tara:strand:- start:230 stop:364 length:135 start_codon:yes stop_codon:yes gene_type:complete
MEVLVEELLILMRDQAQELLGKGLMEEIQVYLPFTEVVEVEQEH